MRIHFQFARFALVGVVGTAGHYATLFLLVNTFQMPPVAASVLGSIVGALINYVLNYKFTFRSRVAHATSLIRFLIVAAAGALLNFATMWLGVNRLRFNYVAVQLVASALVLIAGFLCNRLWTFRAAQT